MSTQHTDWRAAWLERNKLRKEPGSAEYWDSRSVGFKEHSCKSGYAERFLELLAAEPGTSVLDMGCGVGNLALPLAAKGHQVIAADFSAGMREAVREQAANKGLKNLEVKALDWNEDWLAAGIAAKSVDVVLASRSTMVDDLANAFEKLDRTARSKVAITMVTEYGPKGYNERGATVDGIENYLPDYIYGMNLLWQMGAYPELRYIDIVPLGATDAPGKQAPALTRWAFISWTPVSAL